MFTMYTGERRENLTWQFPEVKKVICAPGSMRVWLLFRVRTGRAGVVEEEGQF